jgi:hypothetical protein
LCRHLYLYFSFSDCQRVVNNRSGTYKAKKLTATFNPRTNYVTHYMNLQLYLRLGMKLKKIKKVLAFKQEAFLKKYISTCTELRKKSKTEFGKNLWKLFANAVFGKFIENSRNYLNVDFCLTEKKCKKLVSKPNFASLKIISEDLVLVFSKQPKVLLMKPYAVGFTILERAKEFMYQQFYEVIRPNLGNCEVMMSDTDSFLLACKSYAPTENLDKLKHILDYSNYPSTHKKYNTNNENKLGFWKNENKGKEMVAYCGVRSKSYAEKFKDNYAVKCKGVTKAGRNEMRFENFVMCVKTLTKLDVNQHHIRSRNHSIKTIAVNKIAFSSFDDKRYLMQCGVHSVAYGSKFIREMKSDICPLCKIFNPLQKRFMS